MLSLSGVPLLSLLIFWPVLGAFAVLVIGSQRQDQARWWAVGVTLVELLLAVLMLLSFDMSQTGMQLEEVWNWVPSLGLLYHVGVDGLNVFLVATTALLAAVSLLLAWDNVGRRPAFNILVLLLEAGIIGAFVALDLVLFFVFWEVMLIPTYLVVGILGGQRRVYAAFKFFLYTTTGSLLMLVAILVVHFAYPAPGGNRVFDITSLAAAPVAPDAQGWLFLAFALAFAIKVPLFPLHSWLADLYAEAPLAVLALATMLVKVGAYGFLRIAIPLFPDAARSAAPLISVLAMITILYGALLALAQRDLVRMLAYSSMSHMGFIVLGTFALNTQGVQGAIIQMVNHGVTAGSLFVIAALILHRTGTLEFAALGGLSARLPILSGFFLLSLFSSAGLPGLNSFVGEFLVLLGTFRTSAGLAVLAALGIILAAIYLLRAYRRTMWGEPHGNVTGPDLRARELVALAPLAALVIYIGVFPSTLLGAMSAPANSIVNTVAPQRRVLPSASLRNADQLSRKLLPGAEARGGSSLSLWESPRACPLSLWESPRACPLSLWERVRVRAVPPSSYPSPPPIIAEPAQLGENVGLGLVPSWDASGERGIGLRSNGLARPLTTILPSVGPHPNPLPEGEGIGVRAVLEGTGSEGEETGVRALLEGRGAVAVALGGMPWR